MSRGFALDVAAIRNFLHVLSVTVWIGGQIVVAGLVPLLRRVDASRGSAEPGVKTVTQQVARRFNRIAWPFFYVAIITGLWNTAVLDWQQTSGGWKAAFFAKLILVAVSGVGAWLHTRAKRPAERAMFAALGSLSALAALLLAAGFNVTP